MENIEEKQTGMNMTTGSIPKLLIKFAVPTLFQQLFVVLNSLTMAILVGRFIGATALGAVAVTMPIIFIINSIAMGVTQSNAILIAQAFGRGDTDEVRKIIDTSIILISIICFVCMILGLVFCDFFLHIIKTPPEIYPSARIFLNLTLVMIPFLFIQFLFFNSLRGLGNAKLPMWLQIINVSLNLLSLPLLITGVWGLHKFGIEGAVIATGISQLILDIVIVIILRKQNSIIAPRIRSIVFVPKIAKMLFKIGLPSMLQQVLLNASVIFLIGLVNSFGHHATEGYGVGNRIDFIAFCLSMSICLSVSTISGQNMGVEKYDRVKSAFYYGILFGIIMSLIPSLLAIFFPHMLMSIFINDAKSIAIGCVYLRYAGITYLLLNIMFAAEGIPMAAGQTWVATIFTFLVTCVIRIPLAMHFMKTSLGLAGIWLAMLLSTVIGIIFLMSYFYSGLWKQGNLISKIK